MALIKCTECGHMISDKAKTCPKCGCPVEFYEGTTPKVSEDVKSNAIVTNDSKASTIVPSSPKSTKAFWKNKNHIVALVLTIITIALIVFVIYSSLPSTHPTPSDTNQNKEEMTDLKDDAYSMKESIYNSYIKTLHNHVKEIEDMKNEEDGEFWSSSYSCEYFLFDITKDGIPELWVKVDYGGAGGPLMVYKYEDGMCKNIAELPTSARYEYYKGNDYILMAFAAQGSASWSIFTYDGKEMVEEEVFAENIDETGNDDYRQPTEEMVEYYPSDNEEPIKQALGIE